MYRFKHLFSPATRGFGRHFIHTFPLLLPGISRLSAVTTAQSKNAVLHAAAIDLTQPVSAISGQRRFRSNRSRRGLYDGKDIRSGNNLSFSMKSTKRKFKPNVFTKRVYSEVLDEMVRFHLTTSALRSIDKMGGLDNYLLTSPHVTSGEGLKVKKRIINRLKFQKRHSASTTETSEKESLEAVDSKM
mmetsp:Transcript_9404/g.15099  ORF Transcript_9404/g.15099 Transcript_9404/m.15099 type:complete len:187 (-) Transcript_9404:105-665(-)